MPTCAIIEYIVNNFRQPSILHISKWALTLLHYGGSVDSGYKIVLGFARSFLKFLTLSS